MAQNPNKISLYEALRIEKQKAKENQAKQQKEVKLPEVKPVMPKVSQVKAPEKPVPEKYSSNQIRKPITSHRDYKSDQKPIYQNKLVKIAIGAGFVLILAFVVSIFWNFVKPSGQPDATEKKASQQPVAKKDVPVKSNDESRASTAKVDDIAKPVQPTKVETPVVTKVYQTVSVARFKDDPEKSGHPLVDKIKTVGAGYKAPEGYLSWGKDQFQDLYGKKIKD